MHFGYTRVSADDQDATAQVAALKAAKCDQIFRENLRSMRFDHAPDRNGLPNPPGALMATSTANAPTWPKYRATATVARLFACAYRALGVIAKWHPIELDASDVYVDVSAAYDEGKLVLNVVNRHLTDTIPVTFELEDKNYSGAFQVSEVNGPDIKAQNTFGFTTVKTVSKPEVTPQRARLPV